MAEPPKPTRSRSPPSPILSRRTDESIASQHSSHVNTKIMSSRHPAANPNKTIPPRYPPPRIRVPPKKATPTEPNAPVPKPRKPPVQKTQGMPLPKPRNAAKEVVDMVYEDLDGDEITVQISRPEVKDNLAAAYRGDKRNSAREIPPALPPKNITKEDKELPPLPPRAISPNRRHMVVNPREYGRLEDCVIGARRRQEPVQDDELYEPVNFDACDEEFDSDECSESQSMNYCVCA